MNHSGLSGLPEASPFREGGRAKHDASLKAAQTIEVATRMRYLVPVMYLGSYIMMIIAYGVVFNLDKKTLAQMESDLKERRAKNEK